MQRCVRSLALVAAAFALLHLMGAIARLGGHDHVYGLLPLFDMNKEANPPTFFAAVLLLTLAVLSLALAFRGDRRVASVSDRARRLWLLIALGASYLAYDELFMVHERMNVVTTEWAARVGVWVPHWAWVVPAAGALLVGVVFAKPLLHTLQQDTRRRLLLAAVVFLSGALGVETLGGQWYEVHGRGAVYSSITLIEESLEMSGCLMAIRAMLAELATPHAEGQPV